MSTLFEAVKAIAGGITAINGQLIKGSGYAISAGGKVSFSLYILALVEYISFSYDLKGQSIILFMYMNI